MVLHPERVLSLTENVQQVIVAQKEEPGEGEALGVKVVIQALLNTVNGLIALLQVLVKSSLQAGIEHVRVLEGRLHHVAPLFVDCLE